MRIDDDRDDTYDPEFRQPEDYCEDHGTYIGPPGGADILCSYCEAGVSAEEYREIIAEHKTAVVRNRAVRAQVMLAYSLQSGMSGRLAAELAAKCA